jgi:hypothetical protein
MDGLKCSLPLLKRMPGGSIFGFPMFSGIGEAQGKCQGLGLGFFSAFGFVGDPGGDGMDADVIFLFGGLRPQIYSLVTSKKHQTSPAQPI